MHFLKKKKKDDKKEGAKESKSVVCFILNKLEPPEFVTVVKHPVLRSKFEAFLAKEMAGENLQFVIEAEQFANTPDPSVIRHAIYFLSHLPRRQNNLLYIFMILLSLKELHLKLISVAHLVQSSRDR